MHGCTNPLVRLAEFVQPARERSQLRARSASNAANKRTTCFVSRKRSNAMFLAALASARSCDTYTLPMPSPATTCIVSRTACINLAPADRLFRTSAISGTREAYVPCRGALDPCLISCRWQGCVLLRGVLPGSKYRRQYESYWRQALQVSLYLVTHRATWNTLVDAHRSVLSRA